jgi:lipoate-protein ligase A
MAEEPVLRSYTWTGSWVSFGYSQSLAEVATTYPKQSLVRRWTGGGIVPHTPDWTFSLIVPRESVFAKLRPSDSYRQVHQAVAATLAHALALTTTLSADPVPSTPGACFAGRPAQYDVLAPGGAKLCGGAQRRTRQGFLHQGSVQAVELPRDFGQKLAETLAGTVEEFPHPPELLARAGELAQNKYSTPEWSSRIS